MSRSFAAPDVVLADVSEGGSWYENGCCAGDCAASLVADLMLVVGVKADPERLLRNRAGLGAGAEATDREDDEALRIRVAIGDAIGALSEVRIAARLGGVKRGSATTA